MEYSHLPNVPGIYAIRHIPTGRSYIGSAINLRRRARLHINGLVAGNHPNNKLLNAWRKHGADAFAIECLERCASEVLISREQAWLDRAIPHYNLCPVAGSTQGLKWTAQAKQNASAAQQLVAVEKPKMKHRCAVEASRIHSAKLAFDLAYRAQWLALRKKVMRKKATHLTYAGETKTLGEWAAHCGVDKTTLLYRIRVWGLSRAIEVPSQKGRAHNAATVEYRGETLSYTQLAAQLGVNRSSLCEYAARNGLEKAIRRYETRRLDFPRNP